MKKRFLTLAFVILTITLLSSQISCSTSRTGIQEPDNNNIVQNQTPAASEPTQISPKATFAQEIAAYGKPVMVDFGSTSCIPCKMMVPVLEELKTKYPSQLKTIFVHVNEDPDKTQEFGIRTIPTQIFFDATGKQLELHVGFISTQDILSTFKKYDIVITK